MNQNIKLTRPLDLIHGKRQLEEVDYIKFYNILLSHSSEESQNKLNTWKENLHIEISDGVLIQMTHVSLSRYRSDIYTKCRLQEHCVTVLGNAEALEHFGGDKSYNTEDHFKTNHILDSKLFSVGLLSRETSF